MLIDMHTHAFPEAIAERTIKALKAGILKIQGVEYPAFADGTVQGLLQSMNENGVDASVVLPIATKPKQTESILRFARELNMEYPPRILSFASLHPEQDDWRSILQKVHELGFKGLKFHLEFQGMDVDAPRMIDIFKEAERLQLYITLHAGVDIGLPPPVHTTPQRLMHVLEYVSGRYIIAAHMGGWRMWDDVERYLVGTPILMDTAFVGDFLEPSQYRRIIVNHGADKILFGSDSPWEAPAHTLECLQALGLSQDVLNSITYGNAQRIVGFGESVAL